MDEYREPTPREMAVLARVAAFVPNSGSSYAAQLDGCKVRDYTGDEDLDIVLSMNAEPVSVDVANPSYYLTEGIYLDDDGIVVSLMLHGREGRLGWLEHLKEGYALDVINRWPDPEMIESAEGLKIAEGRPYLEKRRGGPSTSSG